jgi:hypothetical protein
MIRWKQDDVPTLIGDYFNVIPEDIDCHKPSSWEHDALFQPEPRARYRRTLGMSYADAFRSLHVGEIGHFTYWDYFRRHSKTIEAYESITSTTPSTANSKLIIYKAQSRQSRIPNHRSSGSVVSGGPNTLMTSCDYRPGVQVNCVTAVIRKP